ncbi:MAG TPA: MFS transporter [Rhizomicrobium sp.]|jgi:Na+/melibiose symporter-like transporter
MAAINRPGETLSLATILQFSAGSLPVAALSVAIFVYLPPYFASHLGVSLTVIGACWAIVRMVDIPIDPLIGALMDRTHTRFGRYRLWLIAGAPVLMLGVYQLFMAPAHIGSVYLIAWLLVMYLGISMLSLAHSAWSAVLATQYDERSRVFGILTAVGIVAAIVTMLLPIAGSALGHDNAWGVQAMGWFALLITPFAIGLTAMRTPERVAPDVQTEHFGWRDYWLIAKRPELIRLILAEMSLTLGPGWMSALYMFFFTAALGFTTQQASMLLIVYILAGVLGAPATGWLATRLGKHRTLMATSTAYSIGLCGIVVVIRGNVWTALPIMVWCGFMASGFDLMIRAMMADVGDEVRLDQGKERISLLYALITMATKIAGAAAIAITFPLLSYIGFNPAEGAFNAAGTIRTLEWVYLAGPIVFVMLGGACVVGWKLDAKKHAVIRASLEARDALYETAPIIESVTATRSVAILSAQPPAE